MDTNNTAHNIPYSWNRSDSTLDVPEDTEHGRTDIANQPRILLNEYVTKQLRHHGVDDVNAEQLFVPSTPTDPNLVGLPKTHEEITRAIITIADQMEQDHRLVTLVNCVPAKATHKVVLQVAKNIFDTGLITWSRIVMLFYFAAQMAVKSLSKCQHRTYEQLPGLRTVIEWLVRFIKDRVASWIILQGGWQAVSGYLQPWTLYKPKPPTTTTKSCILLVLSFTGAIFSYQYFKFWMWKYM